MSQRMSESLPATPPRTGAIARPPELMIPGPCQLHPQEMTVLAEQVQPHYGPDWAARYHGTLAALGQLLGAHRVHLLPGSGTAALEAAIINLFQPGHRVVVPDTGYFGRRLAAIASAHAIQTQLLPIPPDRPIDPLLVSDRLRGADGILVVHVETSTGVRHPVADIARAARAAGAVCLVDAIASAGGERLDLNAMGIDAAVTASQKGLGAAPGLGVIALDAHGHERVHARHPRTWYFDLNLWEKARIEDPWEPHPVTMPTTLVNVLASSVHRILRHGVADWVDQRAQLARYLRSRLAELGLCGVAPEPHAANLVTVVRCADAEHVAEHMLRYAGILVARGLAPYERSVLRIGLVGCTATHQMVDRLADAVADARRGSVV
jgi:alanine-glyoxylate transaminase/serine-glyoxylate transaminase/serine-pyruvate transaminase